MPEQPEISSSEDERKTKWCPGCQQTKPLESFSKQKGGVYGRRSRCRQCISEQDKQHRSNPDTKDRRRNYDWKSYTQKRTEKDPQWGKRKYQLEKERRRLYPERYTTGARTTCYDRNHWIKRTYDLTEEEFQEMHAMQNGLCAICEKPQVKGKGYLAVDHNHTTGQVRGLLCNRCNVGIGLLGEDPNILEKALIYLRRFQE